MSKLRNAVEDQIPQVFRDKFRVAFTTASVTGGVPKKYPQDPHYRQSLNDIGPGGMSSETSSLRFDT